jgi:hypothetical protein
MTFCLLLNKKLTNKTEKYTAIKKENFSKKLFEKVKKFLKNDNFKPKMFNSKFNSLLICFLILSKYFFLLLFTSHLLLLDIRSY